MAIDDSSVVTPVYACMQWMGDEHCGNVTIRHYIDGPRCDDHVPAKVRGTLWPSLRRQWPTELADLGETYGSPAPLVPCERVDGKEVWPRGPRLLESYATAHGWQGVVTHARGSAPAVRAGSGRPVDSWALRLRSPDQSSRAVVVWEAGLSLKDRSVKFHSAWYWTSGVYPVKVGTIDAMKRFISGEFG